MDAYNIGQKSRSGHRILNHRKLTNHSLIWEEQSSMISQFSSIQDPTIAMTSNTDLILWNNRNILGDTLSNKNKKYTISMYNCK